MGLKGFQGRLKAAIEHGAENLVRQGDSGSKKLKNRVVRGRVAKMLRKIYVPFDASVPTFIHRHLTRLARPRRGISSRVLVIDEGFLRHLHQFPVTFGGEYGIFAKYLETLLESLVSCESRQGTSADQPGPSAVAASESSPFFRRIVVVGDGPVGCNEPRQAEFRRRRQTDISRLLGAISRGSGNPQIMSPLLSHLLLQLTCQRRQDVEFLVAPKEADDLIVDCALREAAVEGTEAWIVSSDSDFLAQDLLLRNPNVFVVLFNLFKKTVVSTRTKLVRGVIQSSAMQRLIGAKAITSSDSSTGLSKQLQATALGYLTKCGNRRTFCESFQDRCSGRFEADELEKVMSAVSWYSCRPSIEEQYSEVRVAARACCWLPEVDREEQEEEGEDAGRGSREKMFCHLYAAGFIPPQLVSLVASRTVFYRPVGVLANRKVDFWRDLRHSFYVAVFSRCELPGSPAKVKVQECLHRRLAYDFEKYNVKRTEPSRTPFCDLWGLSSDDAGTSFDSLLEVLLRAVVAGLKGQGQGAWAGKQLKGIAAFVGHLLRSPDVREDVFRREEAGEREGETKETVCMTFRTPTATLAEILLEGIQWLAISDSVFGQKKRRRAIFDLVRAYSGMRLHTQFHKFHSGEQHAT